MFERNAVIAIYQKWIDIFKTRIQKKYNNDYPQFLTPSRIEKLAQENARYVLNVVMHIFI